MDIKNIKLKIIDDFSDKAPADYIEPIVDKLITEGCINDCMFYLTIDNPVWMSHIYRIIEMNINYQKQKNEKKLISARCFYSLCDDKDILNDIMENL